MRKHILRTRYSENEKSKIALNLDDQSALITLDWAQQLELRYFTEKQAQYYGKKGISYHVSHVMTKIGRQFADHSFVHIIKAGIQVSLHLF